MLNVDLRSSTAATREVAYLIESLDRTAARRVFDTGSGTGARAIALARAGFAVTALEPTPDAVREARRRAEAEAVLVDWGVGDPLTPETWPRFDADAIICSNWWMHLGDRQRMLRRLRQHFPPGVRLVLSVPSSSADAPALDAAAIVRRAGFAIDCRDVDFGSSFSIGAATSVQFSARSLAVPPESLAVSAWGSSVDGPVLLDLRYAPDEADLLDSDPAAIWREVCQAAADADVVSHYPVDDPYGARRATPVVARFFGCDLSPEQVTCTAGVTALLHDLCGLADGGPIACDPLVHGDLEAWAIGRGQDVRALPDSDRLDDLELALAAIRPGLVHIDRPRFTGTVADLAAVERLVCAVRQSDAVVLVDESALPYLGPAASAVALVSRVPNLVVVRGFTKAYSWGGLRCGFAIASEAVARHVRELISPLQVAENSLAAAIRMLSAGDVFERIRHRIRDVRLPVAAALERAGFRTVPGHTDLPWIAIADREGESSRRLVRIGIRPLAPSSPLGTEAPPELIRITVPLSDERLTLLSSLLEREVGGSHE